MVKVNNREGRIVKLDSKDCCHLEPKDGKVMRFLVHDLSNLTCFFSIFGAILVR